MDANVVEVKTITNDTYKRVIDSLRQSTKTSQETMVTAGQFIIEELYNGNYEEAEKKRYSKNSSISKLMKLIRQDKSGNLPSRSTVYNFVNLAIDDNKLKNDDDEVVVQTYKHFSVSHKILLTQVSKLETKKKLIKEIDENKYSVRQLKERIREEIPSKANPIQIHQMLDEKKLEKFDDIRLNDSKNNIAALKESLEEKLQILISNMNTINSVLHTRELMAMEAAA